MASKRNNPSTVVLAGRRRLTARSIIASTLLGLNPPRLTTRALVASAELLGVSSGTARVAISRMVAAGELEPTDDGYRLGGHLLLRQSRQDLSRTGAPTGWGGEWRTAIVPGEPRTPADRSELRRAMTTLRYGELREGAWLRPANLPEGDLTWAEDLAHRRTITVVGRVEDPAEVVRRLWDLPAWVEGANDLLAELAPLQQRLDGGDSGALADAFVAAAAVVRQLEADPLLPPTLLPQDWPGERLRAEQSRFDVSFRSVLRDWHLARP